MEHTTPETKVPTPVVIHDVPEPIEFLGAEPLYTVTEEGQEFKLERFEELFRDIIHRAGSRRGVLDEQALWKAFYFAYEQHIDQIRKDGSPYFTHLIGTARIITDLTDDPVSIQSALLHDIVEDPKVPINVIREKFGEQVAVIVDGVTKISEISFGNMAEKQAANLRKMILAMAQDPRVILVKLSDRLHNMSTIDWLVEKRQKEIARETLDIYAPLAHRLGIWWMKWRLEDLCLKVLDPDSYREIKNQVGSKREQRDALLQQATSKILEELRKHSISAVVQGRAKHFYSIHKKMMSQGRSFDDILDLLAIRIIVSQNDECYAALGHVHALYTPLPDYFADYIASPKSNGYRSIHTKVIGPKGHTLEVQIRTKEMHEQAELGLAAHWRYKENEGWDLVDAELSRWMRNI
ncbi:MAG: HD domain-containing protein, partial [bacterium]|nr:HD domain-containing protein [bacterium]